MKLRNKKTGEVVEPVGITCINGRTFVRFDDGNGIFKFEAHSLAELNEEWEDAPAEPLIKDEKIRKAVRAWWESIPLEAADKLVLYKKNQDLAVGVYTIYCGAIYPDDTLKTGKYYTIAELCGEEEQ